jgi:hypothetical protein
MWKWRDEQLVAGAAPAKARLQGKEESAGLDSEEHPGMGLGDVTGEHAGWRRLLGPRRRPSASLHSAAS